MTSVDIVLPYYNGSAFIKEQLDSILNSELSDIDLRIIFVNDASGPSETEFLKNLLPPNHLYLENETNMGVIKSVERGLKASTAPYVMLCDHDDVWLPEKIKRSLLKLQGIEKNCPALVYTDLEIVGPKLEKLHHSMHAYTRYKHEPLYPSILFTNVVTGCTTIMNRKLLNLALPFPDHIPMHDHWLAVCAVFAGKLELLNEPTILYRQHGRNQVGAPARGILSKLKNLNQTAKKFQTQLRLKTEMAKALSQRLGTPASLTQVVNAFETKNFGFLVRKGVIRGSLIKLVGTYFFFLTMKDTKK